MNLSDRSTLSRAIRLAEQVGYISRVEHGRFDADPAKRRPASYAVRWLDAAVANGYGPNSRPTFRSKNQTSRSVQIPDQEGFNHQTSNGSESRPANRSKIQTVEKTFGKRQRQQQKQRAAAFDSNAYLLLKTEGFDDAIARQLAARHAAAEIERQVRWLPQRNPRANRLGMLRRAIEGGWGEPDRDKKFRRVEQRRPRERDAELEARRAGADQEKQKRLDERGRLLENWRQLSPAEQAAVHRRAIERAGSRAVRSRLVRCKDLSVPPLETLLAMAGEPVSLRN